jgi:hypothetical protein
VLLQILDESLIQSLGNHPPAIAGWASSQLSVTFWAYCVRHRPLDSTIHIVKECQHGTEVDLREQRVFSPLRAHQLGLDVCDVGQKTLNFWSAIPDG